jgi:hypothetical protein
MIIAYAIAAIGFAGMVCICLKLDKLRYQYFCGWKDELANAKRWHNAYELERQFRLAVQSERDKVQAELARLTDRDKRGRFVRKEPPSNG